MNSGNKLNLSDVAIFTFCWGDDHVGKSLRSMIVSMNQANFKRAVLITDSSKTDLQKISSVIDNYGIDVYDVSVDLNSNMKNDDQNRSGFCSMFLKAANAFMKDDFSLNIQHDSAIIDPAKWDSDYLKYDYIGAPWPMHIIQASDMVAGRIRNIPNVVGNGGFSLRSRKFIEECIDLEQFHKNEDLNICIFNYQHMTNKGIRFAPPSLAAKFSVEHPSPYRHFDRSLLFTYNSFGFHGEFNTAGMQFINNFVIT